MGRASRPGAASWSLTLRLAGWLCLTLLALSGALAPAAETGRLAAAAPIAVPAARQASTIVVITIDGPIDRMTSLSVQRRIRVAERIGAGAIVFELNTPGGEVGATLEICNAIKNSPIPNTVAWIHTDAYSAGTFIALACREMVAAEYATMGDAAPIQLLPGVGLKSMSETERQKMLAPLFSEIVDSARRRGYDEKLVQGFVSLGVELWLVEEAATGKKLFIDEAEYRALFPGEPPRPSPRLGQARKEVATGPRYIPAPDEQAVAASDEETTTFRPASPEFKPALTREVSEALDRASERPQLTRADRGKYTLIEYATSGASLLVLKTEAMQRYGFAQSVVRSDEDLKSFFGGQTVRRLDESWSERLVRFLSGMIVRGVLITVFLIAMFIELAAPGISFAGGVALTCLVGLLAPAFLVGAAGWWTAAAVLGGVAFILLELLVFPGVIVLGGVGVVMLFGGLVGMFISDDAGSTGEGVVNGLAVVLLSFFVAGLAMYFIGKAYGTLPVLNRLILSNSPPGEDDGKGMLAAMSPTPEHGPVAVGAVGRTLTDLRPSGTAEFHGRIVDVVSESGFVERGAEVRAVAVTPYRVGVEPTAQPHARHANHVDDDGGSA